MTATEKSSLEDLVQRARGGDDRALESLISAIQDRIYGLAVRMLADTEPARDATQEILIKIVTNLAKFRGDSTFGTWSYRVAVNHLLTLKARKREQFLSFDVLGPVIDAGVAPQPDEHPERALLVKEMRVACTQSMLLCLDRDHRLAYILGEILELDGVEAAAILELSPTAFRKRLSRARQKLESFMQARCGVYDRTQSCRCDLQLSAGIQQGLIDPQRLQYARHPERGDTGDPHSAASPVDMTDDHREVENLLSVAKVYRSHPDYASPRNFAAEIKDIIHGHGAS